MARSPVEFHPEAEQEYLMALGWYRDRSIVAATNFEKAVVQAMARIGDSPDRWPRYFGDCRKYTLRQFPYSIIYQDFSSHILVLAVAHGRRRPRYWKERTPTL